MVTRSDLEKKKTKEAFVANDREQERAKKLVDEGFFYLYRVGKKIYATDPDLKKVRLIQGSDFKKLTDPIVIMDCFAPKPIMEDVKNDI